MNPSKEHNVFSDIPGFDASKGERIAKALQRLWKKIEHLEQIRNSEKISRSKEVQTSLKEDLTITDVKFKLLVLQLQYVRSILKRKQAKSYKISSSKILDSDQTLPKYDGNEPRDIQLQDLFGDVISQETQTGSSLIDDRNPPSNNSKNEKKMATKVSASSQVFVPEGLADSSAAPTNKVLPNISKFSSKPHYHVKLDDVPFILGASSTASHSVIANVQNIIAMMKSHNKALCGPKHLAPRLPTVNATSTLGDSQETTKMLNELSQDLNELALKQAKLEKRFDAAQGKSKATTSAVTVKESTRKFNEPICVNVTGISRRCRSNSESSLKLHADVKNANIKEKDSLKHNIQQKQTLNNPRGQPSHLPVMARRKLLRSLQNFKAHLSEEDISWD